MKYLIYSSFSKSYFLEYYKGVTKDKNKAYRHTAQEIEKIKPLIRGKEFSIIAEK